MQVRGLVEELPRKAEIVAEGARRIALAEGVRMPQPHSRAAGVGDLMRRAKMIGRDIELPRRLKHRDRQIAEPRRLLQKVAAAVVFADQMARLVVDEEEFWNAHVDLRDTLPETVDQKARADRAHKSFRLTIARVVGEAVISERRRIRQHVAGGVVSETLLRAAADAKQTIAGGVDIIGQRNRRRCIGRKTRSIAVCIVSVGMRGCAARINV